MAVYRRAQRKLKYKRREASSITELQSLWEWRLLKAEHEKEKWKQEFLTEQLERAYYGHQMPDWWKKPESWFTINLVFSSVNVLKRSVVPKGLEIRVNPRRTFRADPQLVQMIQMQGSLREGVIQYFTENLKMHKEGMMAYLSSLWGYGCIKVGYTADMEDNADYGKPVKTRDGDFVMDDDGAMVVEPKKIVSKEEFFIDWVDYDCVLVDEQCSNDVDKTARWVAHKIYKGVDELKKDPLYKNTKDLGPSALENDEKAYLGMDDFRFPYLRWGDPGPPLEEDQIAVLYEIYDLKRGEVISLVRGHDRPVRGPEDTPLGIDGHPFEFLKFHERRASFYPIPGIYNWMGPQQEYNIRRNRLATHLKRYGRKYVAFNFEEEELAKFESEEDGAILRADSADARLEPVKDAPLDQANYFDTSYLRKEFDDMSNVGVLQRSVPDADSATEAEIVERRAREGELDEHEVTMEFLSNVTKKLHKCIEANMTQEGAVQVTGPMGANWVFFGPEDFESIEGEFFFEVRAERAARDTLMVERAQLLQLLDIIGKNPLLGMSDVLLRALVDKFPALAKNEALIQEIKQLSTFAVRMQTLQGAEPRGGGGGGQSAPTRGREVSEQSRKVAAK